MVRWKVAGILIVLLLAGCRPIGQAGEGGDRDAAITPIMPGPPVFRENELPLDAQTRDWVQRMHRTPGIHIRRDGPHQHVLFALGQRPTGGFRVELEAVTEHPDYILVQAVEIAPAPGDMVIQILTYPYLLLSLQTGKDIRASVLPAEHGTAKDQPGVAPDQPVQSPPATTPPVTTLPAPAKPLPAPSLPAPPAPQPPVFRENELPLSPETRDWVQRMHRTPGIHIQRDGPHQHVLLALGERPTGGFRVELEAVTEHPDYILVQAVEIAPAPGDTVIQILTYPYLLLSIETDEEEVRASILHAKSPGAEPGQHR
ncbi:MAG TPA: protease complex subunit PrcB family protein [Bacillota bacterium]|nr:protease complex subunit PrcB family protein [Bacillota bacterium]